MVPGSRRRKTVAVLGWLAGTAAVDGFYCHKIVVGGTLGPGQKTVAVGPETLPVACQSGDCGRHRDAVPCDIDGSDHTRPFFCLADG